MIFANYLVGSLPFGLIVSKILQGADPRKQGSGNIGATNVLRVVGKKAAGITLLCDLLKSLPLIIAAQQMGFNERAVLFIAVAGILGHIFSVFLKFKGGKGVAASFGIVLVLAPHVALIGLLLWGGGVFFGKYSSVGALAAFGALPLIAFFLNGSSDFLLFTGFVSFLVYFRHLGNIRRLIQGVEGKI
ncbi:MAG: glycerol-3-phosphate 1-O-acyltransferase PlsY [Nitrospirae bacterium]|nr:glycerol-3-phosphate 1-O-acyltransferase PlsY [Candidatus Manganitrophaceae bacterium]